MIDASLAQLVEHDTLNVGVQGSSPWGGTKEKDPIRIGSFSFFIFPELVPPSEFPESARPRTNLPATPHRKKPEPHGSLKFRITGVPKSLPEKKEIRVRIAAHPAPSTFRAPRAGLRSMHASDNRRKIYRRV